MYGFFHGSPIVCREVVEGTVVCPRPPGEVLLEACYECRHLIATERRGDTLFVYCQSPRNDAELDPAWADAS